MGNDAGHGEGPARHTRGFDAAMIGAVVTALGLFVTVLTFVVTTTTTASQQNLDSKERLVESASAAASEATSAAWEIGTGDLALEAPNGGAGTLIQRRSDEAQRQWLQSAEVTRTQIDAYFTGDVERRLDARWAEASDTVRRLILLGGQLRSPSERAAAVQNVRQSLGAAKAVSHVKADEWSTLEHNPGYTSAFSQAYRDLVNDVRGYVRALVRRIQTTDTRFQPALCLHTFIC